MSRRRNRRATEHTNIIELTQALHMNNRAMTEGPKRKTWTRHDLKHIQPRTIPQEEMFRCFFEGQNICAYGSAGTGKTFIATYLALNEILQHRTADRIIIVRSAVPSREQGFLPGTLEEKQAVYEIPYRDILQELFGRANTYDDMKEAGIIEFVTTSYLRGLTWDNAIVIVDEGQNMVFEEINTVMTRLGENTRIIFTGDLPQTDLRDTRKRAEVTGMREYLNIIKRMESFSSVAFTKHDIVRGPLVKSWIIACEDEQAEQR